MTTPLSLTSLDREKLVELLRKGGFRAMTPERLDEDIEAGLPVNEDGTINLIHYLAWLVREVSDNGVESVQA